MSRLIKFRAWDTKQKKWLSEVPPHEYMLESEDDWSTPDYGEMCEALFFYPSNPMGSTFGGRIVYQQFTGFKDTNNIEIYEGDIVKTDTSHICFLFKENLAKYTAGEVKWVNAGFNICQKGLGRTPFEEFATCDCCTSGLEIIGHIFDGKIYE